MKFRFSLLPLLFFLFSNTVVRGQESGCNDTVFPFLETFDDSGFVCWQPLEGSNWQLIRPGTGSGNGPNKSMVSSSEYANVDSWIVSKAIALPSDTTMPVVLSWDVSGTHYLTYYYRYFVLVSTGDWTDRTTYDTVYADSSMLVYCGNENTNFERRVVSLNAYWGQTIHVAFCNHPLYADPYEGHWMRLNIDNVEVRNANVPKVALALPDHVYSGDSITYAATLIEGNTSGLTYTWHSTLLGTTTTLNNNFVSFNYPSTGVDTVMVVAANAYGVDTATAVVTVLTHPLPQVTLSVPQQVMVDDTVVYTAVVNECSPYGLAFQWHSSLTGINTTTTIPAMDMVYTAAGIDTVTVVVINIDGADTAVAVVEVLNCNGTLIPYVEDFSTVRATGAQSPGELPICWEGTTTGSNPAYAPHVIGSNGYQYFGFLAGSALLMVAGSDAGYGDMEQVVLPRFTQPLQGLAIAFNYRFEAVSRGTLSVGYLDSTDTFVGVSDMTPHAGSYRRDTVSLASVTDSYARLALRWSYNTSYYAVAIGNVEVFNADSALMQPVVSLEVPDEVSIYDTVVYTAHLQQGDSAGLSYTWHSTLLDTTITLNYNFLSVNYPSMGVDTVTVTATNGYGSYTATAIVTIGNCNYRSVPYVDDFEDVAQGQMPECWTSRWTGSASNKPKVTEYAYSWEEDMTIRMIAGNGSSYGNGLSTVVLPGFDHPLNQLSLALDYYNGAYYGTLTVGYLVDTVYTPLHTLPYNFSVDYEMRRDTIDFSSVTVPEARMAIRLINPSMWEAIYLDNIEVFLTSQAGVPPVVSLNGPSNAMALNNITYTATLTRGDTTGVVYMWHSTLQDSMMTGPSVQLFYDTVGVDTLSVIATTPFGSDTAMRIVTVSWPDYLLPSVTLEGSPLCYTCDPATYVVNSLRSDSTVVHSTLLDTTFAMTGSQFALLYTAGGVDTVTVAVANVYGSDTARWVVEVRDCQVVVTFPYVSVPAANDDSLYCWKIWQLDSIRATTSDTHGRWFRHLDSYNDYRPCMTSNEINRNAGGNPMVMLDDWLVSPLIALPDGGANTVIANITLQWNSFCENTTFQILLSTTGRSAPANFSDTLYVQTHNGNYPYGQWESHSVDLSAYAGQTVSIAFHHSGPIARYGWGSVSMDSIKVSCTYDTVDAPDTVWRTVSVTTDAPEACEVYGSGVYADSSTVEIGYTMMDTATVGGHWQFLGWNDGGTGNPRSILVTSDTAIVALFEWVEDSVGIAEVESGKMKVEIYPNPAHGDVTVKVSEPSVLTVLDMTGRVVISPTPITSNLQLPTSDLPSGTYFVHITTSAGVVVKKLIVQ
ncbi:MAG: T9SS type A sorting domain-containing protein [Bacteroidales bacterium]|nr:T9SS type A sorting domain-containing protein [Bacteroidales bacterium]